MAGTVLKEVEPLPAASVLVLRDSPLEILMLRRTESASFVPNTWVFPGGITEALDLELGGMHITGARETFEETGVWLGAPLEDAEHKRRRLLAGSLSFRHVLAEAPLEKDSLVLTSRWITPVGLPKRFDTYFFLATVPRDVIATAEQSEASAVVWIRPAEALQRHAAREMAMVFPTLRNLEALAGFTNAGELIESRRGAVIEPILPVLVDGKPTLP